MSAANFLARMNKIATPQGASPPVAAQAAPAPTTGGFTIPGAPSAPAAFAVPAAAPAPAFSVGVVGAPALPEAPAATGVAPYQVNPPESALPPPEPPAAAEPPAAPGTGETLPEAAAKGGGRKPRAPKGSAVTQGAVPGVSDDYLEHHARQCAALQGAFANPHLSSLMPEDFANFVKARLDAFEALTGAK